MTSRDELEGVVRSWLQGEGHEHADRVLSAVLDDLDTIPQRRAGWLARRFPTINNAALRYGIAAAAVVVMALLGISLLRGQEVGGPTAPPSAMPTPAPSAISSPDPSPTPLAGWRELPDGSIDPGTQVLSVHGVRFSLNIPSNGWRSMFSFDRMERGDFASANFSWVEFLNARNDSVRSELCPSATTAVGPSVTDMAEALTRVSGTRAAAPVDTTVGGVPAQLVVLTIAGDVACAPSAFSLFGQPASEAYTVDSTIRIWVFELNETRYMIHTVQADPHPDAAREILAIVESIRFD